MSWNMISNLINLGVVLTIAIQIWETTRPMKKRGLLLLLGDVHILGPVPWVIEVFSHKGVTWVEVLTPTAIGCLLAIPLILSTKFIPSGKGMLRFKRSIPLYLFLIGIPVLRRLMGFNWFFKQHPIFIAHTHKQNIELMIAMYLGTIVVNIYVWRIVSYVKYLQVKRQIENGKG